jgi:hypothetical protein
MSSGRAAMPARATINDAPQCLNTNDKAMWVTGWNECFEALAAPVAAQPPYPKGQVVGPCVCGSWPGGECLRCEYAHPVAAQQEPVAWLKSLIEKRQQELLHDNGGVDPDTGTWEGPEWVNAEIESLDDLLSRAAISAPAADDLSALVMRLARALRQASPDNGLPDLALDYLHRRGIVSSPLRAEPTGPS